MCWKDRIEGKKIWLQSLKVGLRKSMSRLIGLDYDRTAWRWKNRQRLALLIRCNQRMNKMIQLDFIPLEATQAVADHTCHDWQGHVHRDHIEGDPNSRGQNLTKCL